MTIDVRACLGLELFPAEFGPLRDAYVAMAPVEVATLQVFIKEKVDSGVTPLFDSPGSPAYNRLAALLRASLYVDSPTSYKFPLIRENAIKESGEWARSRIAQLVSVPLKDHQVTKSDSAKIWNDFSLTEPWGMGNEKVEGFETNVYRYDLSGPFGVTQIWWNASQANPVKIETLRNAYRSIMLERFAHLEVLNHALTSYLAKRMNTTKFSEAIPIPSVNPLKAGLGSGSGLSEGEMAIKHPANMLESEFVGALRYVILRESARVDGGAKAMAEVDKFLAIESAEVEWEKLPQATQDKVDNLIKATAWLGGTMPGLTKDGAMHWEQFACLAYHYATLPAEAAAALCAELHAGGTPSYSCPPEVKNDLFYAGAVPGPRDSWSTTEWILAGVGALTAVGALAWVGSKRGWFGGR